ncbi:MAG TPA: hypothetical protein VMF29_05395, partial [Candidatus Edwardsbacteria bacterium]|nr:hypothetical protein [Candidatus Edwardsbacteria bacterium]
MLDADLNIARQAGDAAAIGDGLLCLAKLAAQRSDPGRSQQLLAEAELVFTAAGDATALRQCRDYRVKNHISSGEYAQAEAIARALLREAQQRGDQAALADQYNSLGLIA